MRELDEAISEMKSNPLFPKVVFLCLLIIISETQGGF